MGMPKDALGDQFSVGIDHFPAVRVVFPSLVVVPDCDVKAPGSIGERACLYGQDVDFAGPTWARSGRDQAEGPEEKGSPLHAAIVP